jgi:C-terminal processing protease CtpA/Prc
MKDIHVGDRLLEVDGHDVTQAPFAKVADLLGGSPGVPRTLLLQRGPERLTVHATVQPVF